MTVFVCVYLTRSRSGGGGRGGHSERKTETDRQGERVEWGRGTGRQGWRCMGMT